VHTPPVQDMFFVAAVEMVTSASAPVGALSPARTLCSGDLLCALPIASDALAPELDQAAVAARIAKEDVLNARLAAIIVTGRRISNSPRICGTSNRCPRSTAHAVGTIPAAHTTNSSQFASRPRRPHRCPDGVEDRVQHCPLALPPPLAYLEAGLGDRCS
jgi:hypothetical protein